MGLLSGSLTLHRYLALGPVPTEASLLADLEREAFHPFQDDLDEERSGWVDWRNPLLVPPDPVWVMQDRFAVFALRVDTRKVPSGTLKAHVDLRIMNLMKDKNLAFLGKEARLSVQDEVKAELLQKQTPNTRAYEVAWDLKGGEVWSTLPPTKLMGIFHKTFGVELQPAGPLALAAKVLPVLPTEALLGLDPLSLEVE